MTQIEVKKMIEANEINSTFYALRLLSHGLDTSLIEVIGGEEYPASEFTEREQEHALKIIHSIEESEALPFDQLPLDKIDFYLATLADRIEELANNDLASAGYIVEIISPEHPTQGECAIASPEEEEASWALGEKLEQLALTSNPQSELLAHIFDNLPITPEELYMRKELVEYILNSIRNPQRREAFRASFLEGCSYEEIATRLKVNKSTVCWWLVRDLRTLKQLLADRKRLLHDAGDRT